MPLTYISGSTDFVIIMLPTSKKLREHIGFGLSISAGDIVLQISRLPEVATGKVLLTIQVIYQTKLESLWFIKLADDISDSEY